MPAPKDPIRLIQWKKEQSDRLKERFKIKTNHPMFGKKHSEEQKKIWSQQRKGKTTITEEGRKVISVKTKERLMKHHHLKGKKQSDETKIKRSESQKHWFLTHVHPMKGKHLGYKRKTLSEKDREIIRENRKFRIIPKKDTKPERMMQIALSLNGIKFEKHKSILGQPDIFIEPNVCIFVDGDYWHRLPKALLRDAEVNHKLNLLGYQVIRIWEKDIRSDANQCVIKLMNNLKNNIGSVLV